MKICFQFEDVLHNFGADGDVQSLTGQGKSDAGDYISLLFLSTAPIWTGTASYERCLADCSRGSNIPRHPLPLLLTVHSVTRTSGSLISGGTSCYRYGPMRVIEVNLEQRWNEGAGKMGDPRENQLHHLAHFPLAKIRRPSRGLNPVPLGWEASVLIAQPPWPLRTEEVGRWTQTRCGLLLGARGLMMSVLPSVCRICVLSGPHAALYTGLSPWTTVDRSMPLRDHTFACPSSPTASNKLRCGYTFFSSRMTLTKSNWVQSPAASLQIFAIHKYLRPGNLQQQLEIWMWPPTQKSSPTTALRCIFTTDKYACEGYFAGRTCEETRTVVAPAAGQHRPLVRVHALLQPTALTDKVELACNQPHLPSAAVSSSSSRPGFLLPADCGRGNKSMSVGNTSGGSSATVTVSPITRFHLRSRWSSLRHTPLNNTSSNARHVGNHFRMILLYWGYKLHLQDPWLLPGIGSYMLVAMHHFHCPVPHEHAVMREQQREECAKTSDRRAAVCATYAYRVSCTPDIEWIDFLGLTPYAYEERKSCKVTCIAAKRDWAAMACTLGAMTTSLSVLRASLNYEEHGKNRQERRKNPCDRESNKNTSSHVDTRPMTNVPGATVAERLACSPPTKVNRAQSPVGSLRIYACWNRAGLCRWSVSFLGDLPFSPAPSFRRRSIFASITQDLTVNSRPNLFTHSPKENHWERSFAMARWCSGILNTRLPHRRNGFDSRRGHSRIFTCENRAGRCLWSRGFSRGSPVSTALSSRRCSIPRVYTV
ncbi:hypothetical protein PR048_031203 [Dryococelus australis]|uniref:Uncharacterized protein n=1 Tax=Dryococelus australis TaxID=614101 RepID=A0ABQ9G7H2_9NEOP|nr:hypothetical protein PR048_031203 [Dryococelus australis]